jgi:uncharacterized protein
MPLRAYRPRSLILLVVWLLVAAGHAPLTAQGSLQLPAPQGRVNDFANLLDEATEARLDQLLRQVEDQTTAEIAVATVPTLQGLSVEDYAERLFRTWGIGQEKVDNGVLVLVAPTEREMRIEVGYGLEGVLPDGLAGEIVRTVFLPRFREDDYPGGITAGVERVAEIVRRNHVLTPEERQAMDDAASERPPMWLMVPFFGIFIGFGAFMAGLGIGGKVGFPLIFGGLFGGIPFVMSLIPFFNAPIWILGPLALVLFLVGLRTGRRAPPWLREMRGETVAATGKKSKRSKSSSKTSSSSSGWVMGGSSRDSDSGSSWGSGSSSSGSSFGGGSSGGGGASGKW